MIINIPINIDEDQFNKLVETDYERKIEDRIYKDVRKALEEKSGYYTIGWCIAPHASAFMWIINQLGGGQ